MVQEKDITLGEFLRHEREKRSITIEQVGSATKVGVRTLHLLEEDHYSELPAKPFIRGFVTAYCRFVGLDPKEVLARFDGYISQKTNERPNRESGHSGYAFEKKDGEQQGRTILMFAIFSFVVLGGVAMLLLKPSLHHHRRSHIDKLRAGHTNSSEHPTLPLPSPLPSSLVSLITQNPASEPVLPISAGVPIAALSSEKTKDASKKEEAEKAPEKVQEKEPEKLPEEKTPDKVPPKEEKREEKPQEKHEELKSPVGQPSPEPAPVPSTSAQAAGQNPSDPLDSGAGLKPAEMKHKVATKILADIWVRFQVDDKPVRKFIIRSGRTLILRAREKVWLQVSNPKSMNVKYNTQSPSVFEDLKNVVMIHGVATLFYPHELSEKIKEVLVHEKSLPVTPDPSPDSSAPIQNP